MAFLFGARRGATPNQSGTQLLDLMVSSSANGVTIPIGYGVAAVGANIIWSPGLVEHSTTVTVSSKGGPTTTSTQYLYTASFAAAAAEGPGIILKIWGDTQVLFDQSGSFSNYQGDFDSSVLYAVGAVVKYNYHFYKLVRPYTTLPAPSPGGFIGSLYWSPYTGTPVDVAGEQQFASPTLYSGTSTQMPDPTIQANLGVNFTSAFRGLIYAVWTDLPVTAFGNRMPSIRMLVRFGEPGSPPEDTSGVDFIVENICERCGLDCSLLDVTDLVPIATTTPLELADLPAVGLLTGGVCSFYQGSGCGSPFGFTYPGDGSNPLPTPKTVYHLKANQTLMFNPYPTTVLPGWTNVTGENIIPMLVCGVITGGAGPASWDGSATVPFVPNNVGDWTQANWNMVFTGQLSISVAATYTFSCSANDGALVGIGGGAKRVSGPLVNNARSHQTKTAAKGYPIVMAQNIDMGEHDTGSTVSTFAVSFPAVGNYPIEVDYACHVDARTLSLDWVMPGGQLSPLLPIAGTAGADPITASSGFIITDQKDGRSVIADLQKAFLFDSVESDFKLKFVRRGVHPSVVTIPSDDLGLVEDKKQISEIITQEQDAPRTVIVNYLDSSIDYQQGSQQKQRSSRAVTTLNQETIDLTALVMSQTEARSIAEKNLFAMWMERSPYEINLAKPFYALLDPTDIVDFVYEDTVYQQRLTSTMIGQNYATKTTGVSQLSAAYASLVPGATSSGGVVTVLTVGSTALYIFDLPYLQDTDASVDRSQTGLYWFMVSDSDASSWPGGVLLQSLTGSTYSTIGASSTQPAFGVTGGALPDAPVFWTWDTTSTLDITMTNGSLSAVTDLDVLNGANALIVGQEVVQFVNCVQTGANTYTISRLLRGRRNTESLATGHVSGETVVVLGGEMKRNDFPLSFAGQTDYYKPVTDGGDPSAVTPITFTSSGNDLKPASPVQITAVWDANNNMTLNWIRRTRFGGNGLVGPTPLNEDLEAYSLDVYNGSTFKRTIAWDGAHDANGSPVQFYSAADQTTDGFVAGTDPVTVKIYQLSAQVGRGFPANATITPKVGTIGGITTGGSGMRAFGIGGDIEGRVSGNVGLPPFDAAFFFNGRPDASFEILRIPFDRPVLIPAGALGSQAVCETAASDATAVININQTTGGVTTTIGTINFAVGETVGTFTFNSAVTLQQGDILTIVAPSTQDSTLAGIGGMLAGTR